VDLPGGGQYVFDLFQVVGGQRHDYLLKGDPRVQQTLSSALPLAPSDHSLLGPGVSYQPYPNEGGKATVDGRYNVYGLVKDVATANTVEPWVTTFRGEDGVGLQATVMTGAQAEVNTATYPTIRQAKEDNSKLEDTRGKMIVARRKGTDLSSTFLAILEPFATGEPALRATPLMADGALVGARVEGPDLCDIVVFLRDTPQAPLDLGNGLTTDARFTLVRTVGGKTSVEVVDGKAKVGELTADSGPALIGKVLAVSRETASLTLAGTTTADLVGRRVIVDHADGATSLCTITGVEVADGATRLSLAEAPDFELTAEGTRFAHYPRREISGQPTARVMLSAAQADG